MDVHALSAYYDLPLAELAAKADAVRRKHVADRLELCTIINAKSGRCSEDCRFCAQSAHWSAQTAGYNLLSQDELITGALRARDLGSQRFSLVTSGNRLSADELRHVAQAVCAITAKVGIGVCASLGALSHDELCMLRSAGLSRYHHNLETSREYFARIVTTHSFEERLETVRNARRAGLSVCSGGIIGLGESRLDRISLALSLKELDVDSVPVNILTPIKGTPLADITPLSAVEILKTIAIFRIILPDKLIRLAAGRESRLKDFQGMAFMAGADGMMIGGYLTTAGRGPEDDRQLIEEIQAAWKT